MTGHFRLVKRSQQPQSKERVLLAPACLSLLVMALGGPLGMGRAPAGEGKDQGQASLKDRMAEITKRTANQLADLEALYKHLHTHPELSLHEKNSAARLAHELKEAG